MIKPKSVCSGTKKLIKEGYPKAFMRLQKHKTDTVNNKEYFKYVIVVKGNLIKKLGWKEGDELEAETKSNKLIIMRENKSRVELAGKE